MLKSRVCSVLSIFALGLLLAGCGGSSDDEPRTQDPANGGGDMSGGGGPGDGGMLDLGQWTIISEGGMEIGFENTTHGLSAQFDTSGNNPVISASSPAQPAVSGTWEGSWSGRIRDTPDSTLWTMDEGAASVEVRCCDQVTASITYEGIDNFGSITSDFVTVSETGAFNVTYTVDVQGFPATFTGSGQFGGAEQRGVVGFVTGPFIRSLFHGDRN